MDDKKSGKRHKVRRVIDYILMLILVLFIFAGGVLLQDGLIFIVESLFSEDL